VEEVFEPAGLMISIMRAGTSPAFHIVCIFPRGLGIYDWRRVRPHDRKIESRFLLGDD
jgi:hypothetical protein